MKSVFFRANLVAVVLVTATLAGCATGSASQPSMQSQEHVGSKGSMNMANSDMMGMCHDMHQQMKSAKTPEERRAMMAEHMKHMNSAKMEQCPMMQSQQGVQPASR